MPRVVSLIVLVAIILLIGLKFFQVMVLFIVPLFLAAVLVVIFEPLHKWVYAKVGQRRRTAAALTTVAIVLIVLLPTLGLTIRAVSEGAELFGQLGHEAAQTQEQDAPDANADPAEQVPAELNAFDDFISEVVSQINALITRLELPGSLQEAEVKQIVKKSLADIAAPLAFGGIRIVGKVLVTLAVLIIATYYFFADGPAMLATLMRLSPLDDAYERELLEKFSDISRSVVVATLLSAVVQGALAGAGFYFAGVDRVVFLTGMTIFLAMVPFVGAAAVWIPVCAWLHFHEHRSMAAGVLTVYCLAIVSMIDNFIKPYILHGQSNLHPLLALLSVIGGVQVLGPIGILVGPMLVAFLQALLNMFNKELAQMGDAPGLTSLADAAPKLGSKSRPKKS